MLVYQPIRFVAKPSAINASIFDTVLLQCGVTGYPIPKVQWKKDSVIINFQDSPRYAVVHGNNLRILNVTLGDRGNYYCEALQTYENSIQSSVHSARLDVYSKRIWNI